MKYAKTSLIETKALDDGRVSFVMSTAEVDRMGDIVEQDWDLKDFRKSPIALWNHDHSQPIGRWHDVSVKDGKLTGSVEFMPPEVNEFAASIGKMVRAGFIKACSVGFIPRKVEPLKNGGYRLAENSLHECSIVSVPANASALAYAKSLGVDSRRLFVADSEVKRRAHELFLRRHAVNLARFS